MKKIYLVLLAAVICNILIPAVRVSALSESLSASSTTAVANGSSAITFTFTATSTVCSKPYTPPSGSPYDVQPTGSNSTGGCSAYVNIYHNLPPQNLGSPVAKPVAGLGRNISVSGSGNTLSKTSLTTGSDGRATFTLKSTVAGSKTVKVYLSAKTSSEVSKTVTFTAATSTPTSTPTSTGNTAKPAPASSTPATPKVATITVDGKQVSPDNKMEVEEGKPLVLSGKTVANGTIKLYIFSEPKTATVKADKNGNWSYSVEDLPAGDHHVESEVTDPATGKKSKRATVLAFTVKAAEAEAAHETTSSTDDQPEKKSSLLLPAIAAVVVLLGAGAGFWWWKKKRPHPTATEEPAETVQPTSEPEPDNQSQSEAPETEPRPSDTDSTPDTTEKDPDEKS